MTRFARASQKTQKTAHAATSWTDLSTSKHGTSQHDAKPHSDFKAKHKHKLAISHSSATEELEKFRKEKSKFIKGNVEVIKADVKDITKQQEFELTEFYKKDYRREERRLKRIDHRETDKICFNCREPGHDMRMCPKLKSRDHGTGICFKCGSTEHSLQQCRLRLPPGEFPFAKCFICKETGHLSKQCPDNPRGLYPNGGCCNECGSVEHFRKDCPELQKKRGMAEVSVSTLSRDRFQSADAELSLLRKPPPSRPTGPKVVKF